jgi:hypothetical protein
MALATLLVQTHEDKSAPTWTRAKRTSLTQIATGPAQKRTDLEKDPSHGRSKGADDALSP